MSMLDQTFVDFNNIGGSCIIAKNLSSQRTVLFEFEMTQSHYNNKSLIATKRVFNNESVNQFGSNISKETPLAFIITNSNTFPIQKVFYFE